MLQVSFIGYAVSGAFLSFGFFDLYYALVAIIAVTQYVVRREIMQHEQTERAGPILGANALAPVSTVRRGVGGVSPML